MTRPFDVLVFDWDGTLLDSAGEIVAAIQAAVAELGLPQRTPRQMRRVIGLGLFEAWAQLYPELDTHELMQAIEGYRRAWGTTPRVFGTPFEGVPELLADLRQQGYTLAVATGKSRRGLDKALAALEWEPHFAASRCADETASKPEPLMLEELMWELDVEPQRMLMIGDTSYDIEMARRARVSAVGVAWGVHEVDELLEAGAHQVLDDLTHLNGWLQRWAARRA